MSQIGRLNTVMMALLPELIVRFSAILIKTPAGVSAEMYKLILKFRCEHKAPREVE